jgi:hypothetical protein
MLPAVKSKGLILAFRPTSMRRRIDPAPVIGILRHIGGVIHLVSPFSIRNDERQLGLVGEVLAAFKPLNSLFALMKSITVLKAMNTDEQKLVPTKKLLFRFTRFLLVAAALAPAFTLNADPIADLRSQSLFKDADLSKLAAGNISAAPVPNMQFARDMSVQSAYVVRASVRTTVGLLQEWDPSRHPELRIYLQGNLPQRTSSNNFQTLASAPLTPSIRAFVAATEKLPGYTSGLQYTADESSGRGMPKPVVAFWSQVLSQRVDNLVSGGLGAVPSYPGTSVSPATEVSQLIESSGSARSYFSPMISATPAGGGRGSLTPSLSWQLFDADGQAVVSLDAFYARPVADGYQTADIGYYASGRYYAVVTLQQLWPVQVDGRDATLVWRLDLVSSPAYNGLHGVDRLGSGAATMRQIQQNIRAFLSDAHHGT